MKLIKKGPASAADRVAKQVAKHSEVTRRKCANRRRRNRLEKDNRAWLRWYCPATYYLQFETPHLKIIDGVQRAHETGGRFVVAAERGIGKSAILYGMTFKLTVSGAQPFPVYIPWGENDKGQGFEFWLDCLTNNDRISDDYPEICDPFRHADGISQRVMATTWKDTGKNTKARLRLNKGVIVLPDGLGYIGSSTMGGNPRGLNATQPGGKIIRPTMAMIDDIQDDKVAASQGANGLCEKTIRKVNGAISGLKKAGTAFPILMSGNCIMHGDVMDHYLNNTGWDSIRVSCVDAWPAGWDDKGIEVGELWEEFRMRFESKDGHKRFYRQNKKKLTTGMELTAPKTYFEGVKEASKDKKRNIEMPADAFHAVMCEYYRMGHEAFMAERQQDPVDLVAISAPYEITPELVMARTTDRKPLIVPEWVHAIHTGTDVNPSYALSTVIIGMGQDQTCAVLWYGLHRCNIHDNLSKPEFDKQLYAEIIKHGKEIAAMPVQPETWSIDAGGKNFDPVIRAAAESARACGIPAAGYTGRSWKHYREYGKTYQKGQPQREYCHIRSTVKDGRKIRWILWHADYWREIAQRAWLGDPGAPGACTLPAGRHREFGAQICGDKLQGKDEVGGEMVWNWHTVPGKHDFGDAMAQAYAMAAFGGIGTGGEIIRKKKKANVVIRRPGR